IVGDWAKKNRVAPSKVMLPLSVAAILGGCCSLIGTSTNLVISGLYTKALEAGRISGGPLQMFDVSWVGIPAALAGCALVLLAHRWLLPDRRPALSHLEDPRQYTIEMTVDPTSP